MRYQISRGCKGFGAQELFSNITFEVKDKQKIAIVGRNGCGKTTLLKIIAGIESLDSGDIHCDKGISIGYLSQVAFDDDSLLVKEEFAKIFEELHQVEEELKIISKEMETNHDEKLLKKFGNLQHRHEELGGYTYQSEINTIFTKFGFDLSDLDKPLSEFSGGQKTRIAFVRLLLSKPDILLLDEPTNHLDIETIKWLEGYVKNYPKAVVMVSHDRVFIDEIVDCVYELELGKMKRYPGNYSAYSEAKKLEIANNQVAYERQQKDIARLEEQIEKFRYKSSKAKFAQSKIKYLERMDKIEKISVDDKKFKAHFSSKIKGGNQVLSVNDLSIGYDQELCKINLEIIKGQRVAVIGNNGCGKSTFLKTLMGQVKPLGGDFLFGHQIEVGYFDQNLSLFNGNETVLENLWDAYPELNRTEVRTALGCFLFSGDEVFKEVNVLSGGEKVRLALAHLMLARDNMLILDEPTNHLDILGKEALEESLNDYDGTMLFVSHDRYFINKVATMILEITDHEAKLYPIDRKPQETVKKEVVKAEKKKVNTNINYGKEVSKLEKQIAKKEEQLELFRELRFEPEYYQDSRKMDELDKDIDDLHNEINALMEKWEEYTEIMEEQRRK